MTKEMRMEIEQLVDIAWDFHDQTDCIFEKEKFKLDVLDLISQLPENVAILKIVQ